MHSNIALYNGNTDTITTYGKWPDGHEAIIEAGLSNGSGPDVRKDFSLDHEGAADSANGGSRKYFAQRWVVIDEATYNATIAKAESVTSQWSSTDNCSDFSVMLFKFATNESGAGGLIFTRPMDVGDWIWKKNNEESNNCSAPATNK